MHTFDFTETYGHGNVKGKRHRPSARQILARWKLHGFPRQFKVIYGETEAEFERGLHGRWDDSGNGCRGVDRNAVVKALNDACNPALPKPQYLNALRQASCYTTD